MSRHASPLLLRVLLVVGAWAPSLQQSLFPALPAGAGSPFKGLPRLPELNASAGESRAVFHHEQIVAVVDLAEGRKLLHCELIEVYEPAEAEELLANLTSTNHEPNEISFKDMIKLMDKCDKLDEEPGSRTLAVNNAGTEKSNAGNPLLVGIVPGTKWCGTGDIARSYHDLGSKKKIDRCCRAHDLCPVKIRAYKSRYELTNNSFFSKSHCTCDEAFYDCLKGINHVSANIIGNIYFNIAQPPCIEDDPSSKESSKRFIPVKKSF